MHKYIIFSDLIIVTNMMAQCIYDINLLFKTYTNKL